MEPVRPLMPNVIPVPGLSVKDPQPLKDEKHRAFMDSANNGVIVRTILVEPIDIPCLLFQALFI